MKGNSGLPWHKEAYFRQIIELAPRTDKLAVPVVWYSYCFGVAVEMREVLTR